MNCVQCGKNTQNPKFCSRSCSASYNNTKSPKRQISSDRIGNCVTCGQRIVHPPSGPITKYCGHRCFRQNVMAKKDEIIKQNGGFNDKCRNATIKQYLYRHRGNQCEICGQSGNNWCGKPLVMILDHIDGKSNNNKLQNLRLVCSNCDSQLPTYKAKNRGNSTRSYYIVQKSQ